MYEERGSFPLKKIILIILIIVVIFFILMWLFPTKGYLNKTDNVASVSKTFSENINLMKDAAISYYTDERLPENSGDSKKMTLKQMSDRHLITDLTDSNDERCNVNSSYVEITKEDTEYILKTNLSCNDKKDYINTHMGNYTYCVGDICEKKNITSNEEKQEVSNEESKTNVNVPVASNTSCKYVKSVAKYTDYGAWSNWSKTKVSASNTRKVETKKVNEQTGVKTKVYTTEKRVLPTVIYQNGKTVDICSSEYINKGRYDREVACRKNIQVYKDVPIYSTVTYYRYQDRKVYYQTDEKWDSCNSNLINQGYKKVTN